MFWKLYFWFMVFGCLSFFFVGFNRIWEIIDFFNYGICLIGLFGFTWEKPIFSQTVWRIFLPVMLLWNILNLCFIPLPEVITKATPNWNQTVNATGEFMLLAPMIWALFSKAIKPLPSGQGSVKRLCRKNGPCYTQT